MKAVQTLALEGMPHRQAVDVWRWSWHCLRERFDVLEVWADPAGEAWLNEAGVEYDNWCRLPNIPAELRPVWSISKLLAAAQQKESFVHVDGDVFWRHEVVPLQIPEFLVQHDEGPRLAWWQTAGFGPMPMPAQAHSYNFGVFGGMAWFEIRNACVRVIECLYQHRAMVAGCRCTWMPMLAEQVWVPALLAARGIPATPLLRVGHLKEDADRLGYYHAGRAKADPALHALLAQRWADRREAA